jgi:hypothetical protein
MVRSTGPIIRRMRREGRIPPPVPNNFNYMNTQTREKERQKMIAFIKKRRSSPNRLPNIIKNNISTYYNSNFDNVESRNIQNNKRVYISKDVINGKVKQVYNQDGIIELLLRSEDFTGKSPISRKKFRLAHVIPYV